MLRTSTQNIIYIYFELNAAQNIFKYNSVSNYYKLKSRFLHLKTLSRHLEWVTFCIWISEKQWSLNGDWPLGKTMAGWRRPMRGAASLSPFRLDCFSEIQTEKIMFKGCFKNWKICQVMIGVLSKMRCTFLTVGFLSIYHASQVWTLVYLNSPSALQLEFSVKILYFYGIRNLKEFGWKFGCLKVPVGGLNLIGDQ